jgi:hypothetical protein
MPLCDYYKFNVLGVRVFALDAGISEHQGSWNCKSEWVVYMRAQKSFWMIIGICIHCFTIIKSYVVKESTCVFR